VNFKTLSARKTDTHPLGARVTAKPATETASERRALLSVVVRGMASRWLVAGPIYPVAGGRPDFYHQGRRHSPWYFGLATVKAAGFSALEINTELRWRLTTKLPSPR